MNRQAGFSLIELMIVIAVISIIAAVVYPSYQNQVAASRRADAQAALTGLAQAMERHFTEQSTYVSAVASGVPTVFPSQAPLEGSQKFYNLTVPAVTATTYTLRATPINGQVGDGMMELTSTGIRRWDRNNASGFEASENCWKKSC